ncbi:ybaK/aminoacyl-tRNA synthetase-associated domain-containing protein [Tasmannia lanceolata]|uniref:ybaK/aminoacyl-tRNA synthetase-associated domain-containing protein n=1 Tax=Tasmannia lanceolata TaxID=3420 RepID=UPI0040627F9E
MDPWAELENTQKRILQRIAELELFLLPKHLSNLSISSTQHSPEEYNIITSSRSIESHLTTILRAGGVRDFLFKRVPSDYYDTTLEARREVLGAPTIDHLCKSIVMVNTQAHASVTDCSNRNNSKFYVVVIQYTAKLNAETLKNYLYTLNNGKIPKKKFNLRLAPEKESLKLTGFEHNGVTCIGMKTDIPVILDEAITKLDPDFFWLGGGEIDLKLGIRTSEFIDFIKPFVVNCSST